MATMQRPNLAGQDVPVGGPETVVLSELTQKLARGWDQELGYENQTVPDFCDKISKAMPGRGPKTETVVSQMFKAYTYYNEAKNEPFNTDMKPVVEESGVELTPMEERARQRSPLDDNGYYQA